MKKLNLKLGSIKPALTKEQMKTVLGGYMVTCTISCYYPEPVSTTSTYLDKTCPKDNDNSGCGSIDDVKGYVTHCDCTYG